MILNNDNSYKLQVRLIYSRSIEQVNGREVQSKTVYFGDNLDYPDFKVTFSNKELKEFIKLLKN